MLNKKPKLLIVADYFYPHWTGIAKSAYNLVLMLEKFFPITVLTIQHEKNLKKKENLGSVQIIREPYLFIISRSKYSFSILLKFVLMLSKYDVVFIHSPCINIVFFSVIAKLFGKKLVIFHHGDLILPKSFTNKIIEGVFDISSFVSFSLADTLSTHTMDYANNSRVLKPFLKKCHAVPLPILIANIGKANNKINEIKKLKHEGKIIFGFAGRFVEEKGFDILFEAIPLIIDKLPNARFVFAGETKISYEDFFSKNKEKLEKVKKYVYLLGLLKDSEMVDFYKTIDFIVVPSRSDCFPFVQAEAMIMGVPSIVADIPGARYLVQKTSFGVLFEKENPIDLAEKIVGIINERKKIISKYQSVKEVLNNKKNVETIRKYLE